MKGSLPFPIRRPKTVLLGWLLLMAAVGVFVVIVPGIELSSSAKSYIMEDDRDLAADAEAKKVFGEDEYIVVAVYDPAGVFNVKTLRYVDNLTRAIQEIPGVHDVTSLSDVDNIRGEDGTIIADDLITTLPTTPEEVKEVERAAVDNPTYVKTIYSADKKVASLNVEPDAKHTTSAGETELVRALYRVIAKSEKDKPAGVQVHLAGFPIFSYRASRSILEDLVIMGSAATVLIFVLIWWVFRAWQGVLFTGLVVSAAVGSVYGTMALFGITLTNLLAVIGAMVAGLAMQYSVYVGFAYRHRMQEERAREGPPRDHRVVLAEAMREIRGSVLMSAVGTQICFLSLVANRVVDLRNIGIFLAVGEGMATLAALTVIPAVISLRPPRVPDVRREHRSAQRAIDAIGRLTVRRPYAVLVSVAVIFGASLISLAHLSADLDTVEYFKESTDVRRSEAFVRERMAGTAYIRAFIKADEIDAFKEPASLKKLDDLASYAQTLPHVTKAISHADHIKLLHRAVQGGGREQLQVPDTRAAVEQYLLLHNEPDDFRQFIDADYRRASLAVRMDSTRYSAVTEVGDRLESAMRKAFPGDQTVVVGTWLLAQRGQHAATISGKNSLGFATVLMWLVMWVGLRSFGLATLSLIPNLCPAVMIYAFLPLVGQPVEPATALTGAIALGIAVDDTTHFFKEFRRWRTLGCDPSTAVLRTLSDIGKPMVLSSVVLCGGFGLLLFSRFNGMVWMGGMMVIVSLTAILWDMFCTSALLCVFGRKGSRRKNDHRADA